MILVREQVEQAVKRTVQRSRKALDEIVAEGAIMGLERVDAGLGIADQLNRADHAAQEVGLGEADGDAERGLDVAIGHGGLHRLPA